MIDLAMVLLFVLGVVAIIDWKFKQVPSIFLTGILLATATIHLYNFEVGMISIVFGILSFVYAWMLYEADFIGGMADVKVITIIGLMLVNVQMFFTMMLMIVLFGMAYKMTFKYILKYEEGKEIPFILSLYAVYIALYFIGGVA